jgi:TolB-like protein/Tfp pilus assembly protein PilF
MRIFTELKRRHVFRVAGGYLLLAWLIMQVTDVLSSLLQFPDWVGRLVIYILLFGFPLALLASWVFEVTPEGIKRESEVDRGAIRTTSKGRAVDFVIIAALSAVVAFLVWEKVQPPAPSGIQSVAVLPIRSIGNDEQAAFIAAGLHEHLISQLERIPGLDVTARRSVQAFAGSDLSIREIAAKLKVRHILDASVQKVADQLRVNAQLIEVETDDHLWTDVYDEAIAYENILDVQSGIVLRISTSLETALLPNAADLARRAATDNEDAYRDYLAAMSDLYNPEREGRSREDLLRSAIEKDPEFALAWVRLADIYQNQYWHEPDNKTALERAESALARAKELQPDLPEIHLVSANIRYHGYLDYKGALEQLELAERAMPGSAEVYEVRGNVYRHMGDLQGAIEAYARGVKLDPRDPFAAWEHASTLMYVRRYVEAEAAFGRMIAEFPDGPRLRREAARLEFFRDGNASPLVAAMMRPDYRRDDNYSYDLIFLAWLGGQIDLALEHSAGLELTGDPSGELSSRALKAFVLASAGRTDDAQALFEQEAEHQASLLESDPANLMLLNHSSRVAMMLGNEPLALEYAWRAVEIGRGINESNKPWPAFDVSILPLEYGASLCHAGELEAAADAFRKFFEDPDPMNPYTVASVVALWPPCRDRFVGTVYYEELQRDFGHLSEG